MPDSSDDGLRVRWHVSRIRGLSRGQEGGGHHVQPGGSRRADLGQDHSRGSHGWSRGRRAEPGKQKTPREVGS